MRKDPSLKVSNSAGTFSKRPVLELVLSGGTLTDLGQSRVLYEPPAGGGASTAGLMEQLTFPLGINSGGTGLASVISATNLIGFSSSDTTKLDSYRFVGSNNTAIFRVGTSYVISTTTSGAAAGVQYAATGNQYVTLALAGDLTAERVLRGSTGLTLADEGANNDVQLSVNTNVRDKQFSFFGAGNLTGGKDFETARVYVPFNMQVLDIRLALGTSSAGSSFDGTVNIFGTPSGNAVVVGSAIIAAGQFVGSNNTTFTTGTIHAGSWLGIAVTKSGSSVAGSNLTVNLITRTS